METICLFGKGNFPKLREEQAVLSSKSFETLWEIVV